MKERLVIKNFGPIKSVDLELGKMTILIGEQATGKSTIAKVLAVCRYFSYITSPDDNNNIYVPMFQGLRDWDIEGYLSPDSEIFYDNEDYSYKIHRYDQFNINFKLDDYGTKNYSFFNVLRFVCHECCGFFCSRQVDDCR